MARQATARKAEPVQAISPVRAALARVAQNFSINLAPFPESEKALAFKAEAGELLVGGITGAETHRTAQTLLVEGKRLKRGITEHWANVTRWLEDRKKDIRSIAAMDLENVEPGLAGLNTAILDYEEADRQRIAQEQAQKRQEQERIAREQREKELAEMERQAQAAEEQSEDLSPRERVFVQQVFAGTAPAMAAKVAGFKDPQAQADRLMKTPKITYALEGMKQAQALREQSAAVAEKPIEIRQPEVQSNTAKVAGVRTVVTWTGECFDYRGFVEDFQRGVIDIETFLSLSQPSETGGNAMARSLHENLDRIRGWRHIKKVTKAG